jgi:hypothetical protein
VAPAAWAAHLPFPDSQAQASEAAVIAGLPARDTERAGKRHQLRQLWPPLALNLGQAAARVFAALPSDREKMVQPGRRPASHDALFREEKEIRFFLIEGLNPAGAGCKNNSPAWKC